MGAQVAAFSLPHVVTFVVGSSFLGIQDLDSLSRFWRGDFWGWEVSGLLGNILGAGCLVIFSSLLNMGDRLREFDVGFRVFLLWLTWRR